MIKKDARVWFPSQHGRLNLLKPDGPKEKDSVQGNLH